MCQSGCECSSQISSLCHEERGKTGWRRGGSGMGEQYRRDPSWKKSFAQFYESCICPVGWFYQSLTATVERDLNDGRATKPARCRVRVISQLNALQVNADNALCSSLAFSFLKKSNFYRWLWADTSAAGASVLWAKLVQHLCCEDEKTSWLHFVSKFIPAQNIAKLLVLLKVSSVFFCMIFFFLFHPNSFFLLLGNLKYHRGKLALDDSSGKCLGGVRKRMNAISRGWNLLFTCNADERRFASAPFSCCLQLQNPLQYFLVTHFFPSHLCLKTS